MVEGQQEKGFQQLCFNGRCADHTNRLIGEDGSSFGNRPDIPRKFEVFQILQEIFGEQISAAQVCNVLFREVKIVDIIDQLFQTCHNGKAAVVRNFAEEHIEIGDLVLHGRVEIAVCHGQLVKVTEHGHV